MEQIRETIEVYERLRNHRYRITIENGMELILVFTQEAYHHLAGFHYLTDLPNVAEPPFGKRRFYRTVKGQKLQESVILASTQFPHIAERVASFGEIERLLSTGTCKIIVAFNPGKAQSEIEAEFFLFRRDGNPLMGELTTYYHLFLGKDRATGVYYPATFLVEHSPKYLRQQQLLDCQIEILP